jgi:signal peptidase
MLKHKSFELDDLDDLDEASETETQDSPAQDDPPRPRWRRVVSITASVLVTVLVLVALFFGIVLALIPSLNRGATLTVMTGSMQPTLKAGDLAVVFGVEGFDDVAVPDIVSFQPNPMDPTLVTHRLVGWTTDDEGVRMAITRGDANNASDPPIYEKQLKARMAYSVPYLGRWLTWDGFSKPKLVIAVAALLIAYSAYTIIVTTFRRKPRLNRKESPGRARPRRSSGDTPAE